MSANRKAGGYLVSLLLLAGLGLALWQHQAITDWWKLRGYQPPPEVVALATDTAMTDPARRVFYVNHPELLPSAEQFREKCPAYEQTIVLGCYQSPQNGIYIYDVSDSRLDGVEQVTAAHEMLHAEYDRLSGSERERVDQMLQDYYRTGLSSERIKNTIDSYRNTEPTEVLNEMHSILGTEVGQLPSELESYYASYFTDRSKVVSYSARYEAEFANRLAQIESMDQELESLKARIESSEASLQSQLAQIENDRSQLDYYQNNDDTDGYNALVPAYNATVADYNNKLNQLRADITRYNSLVLERNALAGEVRALEEAIDTRLTSQ